MLCCPEPLVALLGAALRCHSTSARLWPIQHTSYTHENGVLGRRVLPRSYCPSTRWHHLQTAQYKPRGDRATYSVTFRLVGPPGKEAH